MMMTRLAYWVLSLLPCERHCRIWEWFKEPGRRVFNFLFFFLHFGRFDGKIRNNEYNDDDDDDD
jgi:hypothetical protein